MELAKSDCADGHFRMPGQIWPEDITKIDELVDYIKQNSLVNIGFEEQTEEYANCVLTVMDFYETKKGSYVPNQKLMNAVVNCAEIGLTFNTPKYGRCVLKLIK